MIRPVFIVSLILSIILAACGGVRIVRDRGDVQLNPSPEKPAILETPLPASATPKKETETSVPALVPTTPTEVLAEAPVEVTETSTPAPITATPSLIPTDTPANVETVEPVPLALQANRPYRLQPGSPAWLPNFIHPESGCNWSGVAGQVFDKTGNPVTALVVEVGGSLGGNQVQSLSLTGIAPAYGPGGYEVFLGDRGIDSSASVWLQLKDLSGKTLSDQISFDTFSDCTRNLVLINFVESGFEIEVREYFVPVFYNGVIGSESISSVGGDSGDESAPSHFYFPLFYNRFLPEPAATPIP